MIWLDIHDVLWVLGSVIPSVSNLLQEEYQLLQLASNGSIPSKCLQSYLITIVAFDRTGRIINITVAPINNYDPPRLLNYLTAPHICVWSAAAASCAVPGLFDSITLIVKEPNGKKRKSRSTEIKMPIPKKDAS